MIKIIRQPINVFPNDTVIDFRSDVDFSFTFQGDKLEQYVIGIVDITSPDDTENLFNVVLENPVYNGDILKYKFTKENAPWTGNNNSYNERWWYLYFGLPDFKNCINSYISLYDIKLNENLLSFEDYSKETGTTQIVLKCYNKDFNFYSTKPVNLVSSGHMYLYYFDETLSDNSISATEVKKIISVSKGETVYKDEEQTQEDGTKKTVQVFDYQKVTITLESAFDFDIEKNNTFVLCKDVIKSPPYYFYAHRQPAIITYICKNETEKTSESGCVLNSRKCLFEAQVDTYQQNIKYHQFDIYKGNITTITNENNEQSEIVEWNENSELIYSTGKVYNANTKFSHDGFVGEKAGYVIQLTIMTDKNVLVKSTGQTFFVEYTTPNNELAPNLEIDYEKQAINVSWLENRQSFPTRIGNADFKQDFPFIGSNCLKTGENTILTYNNLNNQDLIIDEDNATIMFKVNLRRLLEPFKAGKNEKSNLKDEKYGEIGVNGKSCIAYKSIPLWEIDYLKNENPLKVQLRFCEEFKYLNNDENTYAVSHYFSIYYKDAKANELKSFGVSVIPTSLYLKSISIDQYDLKYDWFLFVLNFKGFIYSETFCAKVYPMSYQVTWKDFNKANPTWNEFNDKVQSWDRFNETNLFK